MSKTIDIQTAINNVLNTLNIVEVRGKNNINHLLGSIMMLEQVRDALMAQPEVAVEGVEDVDGLPAN